MLRTNVAPQVREFWERFDRQTLAMQQASVYVNVLEVYDRQVIDRQYHNIGRFIFTQEHQTCKGFRSLTLSCPLQEGKITRGHIQHSGNRSHCITFFVKLGSLEFNVFLI